MYAPYEDTVQCWNLKWFESQQENTGDGSEIYTSRALLSRDPVTVH